VRFPALGILALALLTGCGASGNTESSTEAAGGGSIVVAALGDSITAGSPLWDPDPAVRRSIPDPNRRSQFEYWATRENPDLEFRNCGVFGQRTDEIAARLADCANGADVVIVQGGINDIAQGHGVESAAVNMRDMVERGKEMGVDVVMVDVLPWNNGHPRADAEIEALNRAIHSIGGEEGVEVLPFHDTLESADVPGTMRPDWTIDGDHPSIEGYRRLGELVARYSGFGLRSSASGSPDSP
jgi:lysophospholipase L1-like esterase